MAYYNADELIIWAKENDLMSALSNVLYNNNKGWSHIICPCKSLNKDEKGNYISITVEMYDTEEIIPFEHVLNEDDLKSLQSRKCPFDVIFILRNDEMHLQFLNEDINDNNFEEYVDAMVKDFIEFTGINTRGKLKAVIKEGNQLLNNYMQGMDYLRSLSDN